MTRVLLITFVSGLLLLATGFRPANKATLKMEVTGFEEQANSKIWVSVFSEKGFLETPIQRQSVNASGGKISVNFDLPAGEYAISTYHDLNGNKEIDRYFFGKPKEPYGFSNNVKPLGPPAYSKCKITLGTSAKTISIKLIN